MTLGEAKTRALKLMGEYSYMGKRLSETESDTADWRLRLPELIDDAQRAAAEICPVWRRREIAHYPPKNRAKGNSGILIHADKDIIVEATDVRAFSFRVMGNFTVYLEQSGELRWQVLRTLSGDTGDELVRYCGRVEGNARRLRLRFAGGYRYLVRDAALYAENFASDAEIPADSRATWYPAPEDYYRFGRVTKDGEACGGYRWYLDGNLSIPSSEPGFYVLEYGAYPAAVSASTPEDTELETEACVQRLLPYYAAAMLLSEEDPEAADRLMSIWKTGLAELTGGRCARQTQIRASESAFRRTKRDSLR